MNICNDCKRAIAPASEFDELRCAHPKAEFKDLVSGVTHQGLCRVERHFGECGMEGKFFEPADTAATNKGALSS